jgi:hypothetical protein
LEGFQGGSGESVCRHVLCERRNRTGQELVPGPWASPNNSGFSHQRDQGELEALPKFLWLWSWTLVTEDSNWEEQLGRTT